MKIYIVYALALLLVGCTTAQFVPSGPEVRRPVVPVNQVSVFYSDKDVPFAHQEIGRVFMDMSRGGNPQPHWQIAKIRERAGQIGAEEEGAQLSGGGMSGGVGGFNSFHQVRYSGIAIVKTAKQP